MKEFISDNTSFKSNHSNEVNWSDHLNLRFNTQIFTQNSDYIVELGNIYAAKAQIDQTLSEIMPSLNMEKKIAKSVKLFMEAIDYLRMASKKCISDMEEQRKGMYQVAKKMLMLRDSLKN